MKCAIFKWRYQILGGKFNCGQKLQKAFDFSKNFTFKTPPPKETYM